MVIIHYLLQIIHQIRRFVKCEWRVELRDG